MDGFLIMLICVLANHLGLIEGVEGVIRTKLPIINCPKCSTFWFASTYMVITSDSIICAIVYALFLAYASIWMEMLFGLIDKQYDKLFAQIFGESSDGSSSSHTDSPEGEVSKMSK